MDHRQARVLLTNDDGIAAAGLRALAEAATAAFGSVFVAAPRHEQSASSHALTIHRPVHVERIRPGWFAVDGTPADCVNLAFFRLLDGPPDLVLSGVNRGYNLGEDVTYSGTVAGALEGRLLGAPAIAVSAPSDASERDLARAAEVAVRLAHEVLQRGLPLDAFLNVNVPPGATGFRVTRQGQRAAREGLEETPAQAHDWRHSQKIWGVFRVSKAKMTCQRSKSIIAYLQGGELHHGKYGVVDIMGQRNQSSELDKLGNDVCVTVCH